MILVSFKGKHFWVVDFFFPAKFWDTEWRWCCFYPKSHTDSHRCIGGISSASCIKKSNEVLVLQIYRFKRWGIFVITDNLFIVKIVMADVLKILAVLCLKNFWSHDRINFQVFSWVVSVLVFKGAFKIKFNILWRSQNGF